MARRRLMFFAALIAVFAGSIVAWTGTTLNLELSIDPYNPTGEAGDVGKLVLDVTPIGETFSIPQGATQKIRGVELYKIELADKEVCDDVRIQLTLLNPYDMGKALNNESNSFIEVGVYYPDPNGGFVLDGGSIDDGTCVRRDDDARASAIMSRVFGDVVLHPSETVTSTLYILASIMVSAGGEPKAPPGQQQQLTNLDFWCDVRK